MKYPLSNSVILSYLSSDTTNITNYQLSTPHLTHFPALTQKLTWARTVPKLTRRVNYTSLRLDSPALSVYGRNLWSKKLASVHIKFNKANSLVPRVSPAFYLKITNRRYLSLTWLDQALLYFTITSDLIQFSLFNLLSQITTLRSSTRSPQLKTSHPIPNLLVNL